MEKKTIKIRNVIEQ